MNDLDTSADRGRPEIKIEKFWTDFEPDPFNPGTMRPVDKVTWVKRGDQHHSTVTEKIARLCGGERPGKDGLPTHIPPAIEWLVIEAPYKAWKERQEMPVSGTPLEAWPGMTPEQVRVMKGFHLDSVEDVAEMGESVIMRCGIPGIREIKKKAQAFLTAQRDTSKIEAALSSRDAEIEALKAMVADLQAARAAEEPAKRGPGRPPKQPVEIEA